MNVLHGKFEAGAFGRFHEPQKEICSLSAFKIYTVVARSLKAKFVDVVLGDLSLNFVLFFSVRQQIENIIHQVSET